MTPVRTVIVDDDTIEGGGLADLLRAGGDDLEVVLQAPLPSVEATAASTLKALGEGGPRLLLVDYRLGDNPIEGGDIVRFKGGSVADRPRAGSGDPDRAADLRGEAPRLGRSPHRDQGDLRLDPDQERDQRGCRAGAGDNRRLRAQLGDGKRLDRRDRPVGGADGNDEGAGGGDRALRGA